jgi:hypothetical protein
MYCQLVAFACVSSGGFAQDKAQIPQNISLEVGYDKNQLYETEVRIEHSGTVIIETSDKERQVRQYPIDVKGHLKFHERFIGTAAKPQAVRQFSIGQAKMLIDKTDLTTELEKTNRIIVSRIKSDTGNKYQHASVESILQQRELELLRNPCDPLSFGGILNRAKVAVGKAWEPDSDALARLMFVDRVIYSTVTLKLTELNERSAKLHLVGKIKAEVDDTLTEMAVAGIIQVDRELRIVNALRMTINEHRRAAQIAPGFKGQTKIDLVSQPSNEVIEELSLNSLKEIAKTKVIRNVLRWASDSGNFALVYDPAWKMITTEDEAAILRFVESGDLLTQCSIVRLPSRPADKPLGLKDFQEEVAKIITKDPNSRIEQADEGTNANGLKTLRVLVSGVEEEVRMNWLYYNVASSDGRQVTFVFMLEEQVFDRVESTAQRLVDGFVFNKVGSKLKLESELPETRDAKSQTGEIR